MRRYVWVVGLLLLGALPACAEAPAAPSSMSTLITFAQYYFNEAFYAVIGGVLGILCIAIGVSMLKKWLKQAARSA